MVNNQTFISGRYGRALYAAADEWWIVDLGLSPRLARRSEISNIRSMSADYRRIGSSSVQNTVEQLSREAEWHNILFLVISILDPANSIITRLHCAQAINSELTDGATWSTICDHLLSAPLTVEARVARTKTLGIVSSFERIQSLLETIYSSQQVIDEVFSIFDELTKFWTPSDVDAIKASLTEDRVFATIVRACQARDSQSFNAAMVGLMAQKGSSIGSPQRRALLASMRSKLEKTFFFSKLSQAKIDVNAQSVYVKQTFAKDLISKRTPRSALEETIIQLSPMEAKSRVDKQMESIRREILADKPSLVKRYIDELIEFQMDHSEREHLAKTLCSLASFSISANNLNLATQLSDYAVTLDVVDEVVLTTRGEIYKNIGHFEAALGVYSEAVFRFPESSYAWNGRADVLKEAGRFDEALSVYQVAQAKFPDSSVAWNGYTATLRAQGRRAEALEKALETVELFPDDAVSIATLASALAANGKYDEAIIQYEKIVNIETGARAMAGYIRALNASGQQNLALQKIKLTVSRFSENLALKILLVSQLRLAGRIEESITVARSVLIAAPGYMPMQYQLAASLVSNGNLEEGKKALPHDNLRSEADWSGYRFYLLALISERQYSRAKNYLLDATKKCPWRWWKNQLQTLLGFVQFKLKKATEAIRTLETDIDRLDDHSRQSRLVIVGAAQKARGKTALGIKILRTGVASREPSILAFRAAVLASSGPHWNIPAETELRMLMAA